MINENIKKMINENIKKMINENIKFCGFCHKGINIEKDEYWLRRNCLNGFDASVRCYLCAGCVDNGMQEIEKEFID